MADNCEGRAGQNKHRGLTQFMNKSFHRRRSKMRKQLFKLLQIVLFLLLLGLPQHINAHKKLEVITKGLEALTRPLPRGSWSYEVLRYFPHKYDFNPSSTIGLTLTGNKIPFEASTIVHPSNNVLVSKLPALTHQFQADFNYHNREYLPSSILSLTPEMFYALAQSFKAAPSNPLYGIWRIKGWVNNEIQPPNLRANRFSGISKDEYILITPDMNCSYIVGEQIVASCEVNDVKSLPEHNTEDTQFTVLEDNVIAIDVYVGHQSRLLFLERPANVFPTSKGHTIGLERAVFQTPNNSGIVTLSMPQRIVEKDIQSQYPNELESKQNGTTNELSVPISTPINDSDWWLEYIKHEIEEQMIKLGMQIQFDFKMEEDTVGYIIYIYGYEYKPEAA